MYPKEITSKIESLFVENTQPILVYALEIGGNPNWKHTIHQHNDMCEIILIVEGKGTYIIDNEKYSARKGDLLVYNRGILHDERSDNYNPLKTYSLGVNNIFIKGYDDMQIIPPRICPIISTNNAFSLFEDYFTKIIQEFNEKQKNYDQFCQNLLIVIIILINRIIRNAHEEISNGDKETITSI